MRLTTKGRYAVTAMLDVAINAVHGPVSLADVAMRQHLSQSYLEQLFAKLRRAGLVNSVRGPGGGYRLNRTAAEIDIAQIIAAVDESVDSTNCGGGADCLEGQVCLTHNLWSDLTDHIYNFLSNVSLESLLSRHDVQSISTRQNDAAQIVVAQLS